MAKHANCLFDEIINYIFRFVRQIWSIYQLFQIIFMFQMSKHEQYLINQVFKSPA